MSLSTQYLITLLKTPKIGMSAIKSISSLVNYKLSNVSELLDAILDAKKINARIAVPELSELKDAYELSLRTIENCERLDVKAIGFNDIKYPEKLKRLSDFPIVIYLKGNLDSIHAEKSVAIIGTRQPSDFGLRLGKRTSGLFAEQGFSIISGLAIGCDTVGHLGAVEKNRPTVAVLASGVDIIYPKENKELSHRIIETGGALLSEYEPGTRSFPQQFVARDRIQAGLADGLIVIETGIKGGTMHAVGSATNMGMPIGCITGHPASLAGFDKIAGNTYLISKGASPLGSPEQIENFMRRINPNIILSEIDTIKTMPVIDEKPETTTTSVQEETENTKEWTIKQDSEEEKVVLKKTDLFTLDNSEPKTPEEQSDHNESEITLDFLLKKIHLLTTEIEKLQQEQKEQAKIIKLLLSEKNKKTSKKN